MDCGSQLPLSPASLLASGSEGGAFHPCPPRYLRLAATANAPRADSDCSRAACEERQQGCRSPEGGIESLEVLALPAQGGAVHLEGGGEVGGAIVETLKELAEEEALDGAGEGVVGGELIGGDG